MLGLRDGQGVHCSRCHNGQVLRQRHGDYGVVVFVDVGVEKEEQRQGKCDDSQTIVLFMLGVWHRDAFSTVI